MSMEVSEMSLSFSPSCIDQTPAIVYPCAACRILRRRCTDNCVLAPYFPPTDPIKFTTAHRVFGASNIIKFLQELPESQRADAVSSIVYEANARLRDPVYGSAGAIFQLQRQVKELQMQLAKAQAQLVSLQCEKDIFMTLICNETTSQMIDINMFDNFYPFDYPNNVSCSFDNLGMFPLEQIM